MTAPPPTMQTQPGQGWDSGPPAAGLTTDRRVKSLDLPNRHPLAAEHKKARPVIRGRSPVQTVCINCNENVITETESSTGLFQYVAAIALCFCGCWCCFFIPLMKDDLKDCKHTCPNCGYELFIEKML